MKDKFFIKTCILCKTQYGPESYLPTNSQFYHDGHSPICNTCLEEIIKNQDYNWQAVDKVCQYLDIPFVPKKWDEIYKINRTNPFTVYAQIFREEQYKNLDWGMYFQKYSELRQAALLEDELPEIHDQRIRELQKKWGPNYDEEELDYLENLYIGILNTQSINGKLQTDQAQKLCKISLEIEGRIRAGQDFEKLLKSYETLVKIAEFTPKNAKNANDFDSVGELFKWLEKRGWKNQYYDGATKDIVDETLHNIQVYNQRLYTNESGIGEEINQRIEALKSAQALEKAGTDFGTDEICDDFDQYEVDGYDGIMKEDFDLEVGETV